MDALWVAAFEVFSKMKGVVYGAGDLSAKILLVLSLKSLGNSSVNSDRENMIGGG